MYLCPLCMKTEYLSLDSLCFELTKVTIKHIRCPVCAETVLGLDKYTIHLYSHLLQKEKLSKGKSKNETVTLNALVKNMCKALDTQDIGAQNKSSKNYADRSTPKVAKMNEMASTGNIAITESKRAQKNSENHTDTNRNSVTQMTEVDFNSYNYTKSYLNSESCGKIDNFDRAVEKNSLPNTPLIQVDFKSALSPIDFKSDISQVDLKSAQSPTNKSSLESSSVVLSFATDLAPSVEKLSNIISQNFPVYSPPMREIPESVPAALLKGLVLKQTIPIHSNALATEDPNKLGDRDSPQLLIMLPEVTSPMNIEPTKTSEISQSCQTDPELITMDTREILVTNFTEPESQPRSTSPFEFEEFIKLKPSEKTPQETHKCNRCNFSFPDMGILKMHEQLVHRQNALSLANAKSSKKMYYCQYCNKGFKMKGSLLVHHRVAHKHLLPNWENGIRLKCTEGRESPTEVSHRENEHKCNICSKTFKKEQFLSQHLKTHESKQWECDVCTKSFTTKYFLKKHKRLHTGEQRYLCELCNKAFTFQQSYHKHVLYHTDEKPYPCTTCGRAFKELSTLHNHERIHTGEKPYSCQTCGKSFRQRISCLVHSRIHTGAMPYECTACHKKFRYKCSEKSHKCPVSPPGQIVLRDTEKKCKSLLSSIKKRLSASEHNSENSKSADSPTSDQEPSLESKEPTFLESTPPPPPQYYIVMPVAQSPETTPAENLMSLKPVFDPASATENLSENAPQIHAENGAEEERGGNFGSAYNSTLAISAPDFFSDPDELFSSLTFSP